MQGSPYLTETKDADIFDGVELVFNNAWSAQVIDSLTKWVGGKNPYLYGIAPLNTQLTGPPVIQFKGIARPSDYSIIFSNTIVDTSYADPNLEPTPIPVNFRVYNETESTYVKFIFRIITATANFLRQTSSYFSRKLRMGFMFIHGT